MLRWLGAALALAVLAPPAHAATIAVSTATDSVPGDAACSLREALLAANTDAPADACPAGSGFDVVQLAGVTYPLTQGQLAVTSAVEIRGTGASATRIDAGHASRVLSVQVGASLNLLDLTVANGRPPASASGDGQNGGGIAVDRGTLVIRRSVLDGNRAGDAGTSLDTFTGATGGSGGGVLVSQGSLTFEDSILRDNRGGTGGPAPSGEDALAGGHGGDGGAIYIIASTVSVRSSTLVGNRAGAGGPPNGASASGSAGWGGAIKQTSHSSTTAIVDSTLYANETGPASSGPAPSTAAQAAAVHLGQGTASLTHTTMSGNTGPGGSATSSLEASLGATVTATGSILDGRCAGTVSGTDNLTTAGSGCPGTVGDPALSGLGDHGGATPTLLPGPTSAAIDGAPEASCTETDQRSVTRPQGAGCDFGAVERRPTIFDLTPARVDFGLTTVGLSTTNPLELTYTSGDGPVTVGTASLGGAHPGDFALQADACSGATLTPGQTCELQARFAPVAEGLRTAELSVAIPGSTRAAALEGTGVAPPPPAPPPPPPAAPIVTTPPPAPARRPPLRLTARSRLKGTRLTTTGTLTLPSGLTKAQACGAGRVTITVKKGRRTTISTRRAPLSKNCTFRSVAKFRSLRRLGKRITVRAQFTGNDLLSSRRSASRSLRVRR